MVATTTPPPTKDSKEPVKKTAEPVKKDTGKEEKPATTTTAEKPATTAAPEKAATDTKAPATAEKPADKTPATAEKPVAATAEAKIPGGIQYTITTKTGDDRGAGTDSNVFISTNNRIIYINIY